MSATQPVTKKPNASEESASTATQTPAPALPAPFAGYGQLGYLSNNFINQKIAVKGRPLTWNVHGVDARIVSVTPDGKLLCDVTGSEESSEVLLDEAAFAKLMDKIV